MIYFEYKDFGKNLTTINESEISYPQPRFLRRNLFLTTYEKGTVVVPEWLQPYYGVAPEMKNDIQLRCPSCPVVVIQDTRGFLHVVERVTFPFDDDFIKQTENKMRSEPIAEV